MKKYVKFPLVLGIVALVSGALLAGTYNLTKDKIEQGKIDRQTSAINDLFTSIDSKEVVEVPSEFKSQGVDSIVKVKSKGKEYNCYTITFKDSVGGDQSTVIIALDSKAKVYGVKFLTIGDSYLSKYNNKEYFAKVVKNNKFDAISDATMTGNDLNKVLKIAVNCFKGKVVDPMDELFNNSISNKEEIVKPSSSGTEINKIYKVNTGETSYYVFDISYNDEIAYETNMLNLLYALNEDGSFYKLKVVDGDGYADKYDMATSFDAISHATVTANNLEQVYTNIVTPAYLSLTQTQGGGN